MRTLIVAVGSILFLAAVAGAQPMTCGNGFVGPGDSQLRVLQLCGAPEASRRWVQTIYAGDDDQGMQDALQVPMAEWVYQSNPDQFASKVLFRNGVVAQISSN